MTQIIINIVTIFVLPVVFGFLFRFALGKRKKGILLTLAIGVIACGMWWAATHVNTGGREALAVLAYWFLYLAGGAVLGEIYFLLQRARQKDKDITQ